MSSSARRGTLLHGGKSAYSGSLVTLSSRCRSSSLNLLPGSCTVSKRPSWTLAGLLQRCYVLALMPITLQASDCRAPAVLASSIISRKMSSRARLIVSCPRRSPDRSHFFWRTSNAAVSGSAFSLRRHSFFSALFSCLSYLVSARLAPLSAWGLPSTKSVCHCAR